MNGMGHKEQTVRYAYSIFRLPSGCLSTERKKQLYTNTMKQ